MHTKPRLFPALAAVAAVSLPLLPQADETVQVGGSGGLACSNSNDPPTLDDGLTEASGDVTFAWDGTLDQLTVTVANTSPVDPGVPNPQITDVWFNLPIGAVDTLSLVSQTDGDGLDAGFGLTTDFDLADGQNDIKVGCFGAFGVHLANAGGGIAGGIKNPAADTTSGSPINGPVTFVFDVAGPGVATLTDGAFTSSNSVNPPGSTIINVSLKFQGGGLEEASDKISSAPGCKPGGWMNGEPCIGNMVEFVMSGGAGCHGCLLWSLDPGPTDLGGGLVVPLGMPANPLLVVGALPASGTASLTLTVPNDPAFIDLEIFFVVALQDLQTQAISIGDQFSVTICE